MIRDRGNIKWTAMMLPEHVTMLRELKMSENKKLKPFIDEQQLQEMNETIRFAMETQNIVAVTYYKEYEYKDVVGIVKQFDFPSRCIRVINYERTFTINLENIIDVKIAHE